MPNEDQADMDQGQPHTDSEIGQFRWVFSAAKRAYLTSFIECQQALYHNRNRHFNRCPFKLER